MTFGTLGAGPLGEAWGKRGENVGKPWETHGENHGKHGTNARTLGNKWKTDIGKKCGKMWGKPWREFGTLWDVGNTWGKEIRKSGDVREHLEVVHVFDLNIMK